MRVTRWMIALWLMLSVGTAQADVLSSTSGITTVQDEGTALAKRKAINFTGSGVTCTDSAGSGRTNCDIPGGSSSYTIQTISSNTSISGQHKLIRCDATSGAVTVTLPAASAVSGADFVVKKIDTSANTCTVSRAGSDTIDGGTTAVLTRQYEEVGFVAVTSTAWDLF